MIDLHTPYELRRHTAPSTAEDRAIWARLCESNDGLWGALRAVVLAADRIDANEMHGRLTKHKRRRK